MHNRTDDQSIETDHDHRGERVVILLGGLRSQSQVTSDDHTLRDDFSLIRGAIHELVPTAKFVYFSYGRAGPNHDLNSAAGSSPGWQVEFEPVYSPAETTDRPLADHVAALDSLITGIRTANPDTTIDLVGFSLGGMVALAWAAHAHDVAAIHRIVLVSVPVGGISPLGLLTALPAVKPALRLYDIDFGRSQVFEDIHTGSPLLAELGAARDRVDVSAVENSRDYVVNGQRICGQALLPAWVRTIPLGRGARVSGYLPLRECFWRDLGGWDRQLRKTHHQILRSVSTAACTAHSHIAQLLATDGPLWTSRQAIHSTFGRPVRYR